MESKMLNLFQVQFSPMLHNSEGSTCQGKMQYEWRILFQLQENTQTAAEWCIMLQ